MGSRLRVPERAMTKGERGFGARAPAFQSRTLCSDSHVTQLLLPQPDHPAPTLHPKVPPGSAPPRPALNCSGCLWEQGLEPNLICNTKGVSGACEEALGWPQPRMQGDPWPWGSGRNTPSGLDPTSPCVGLLHAALGSQLTSAAKGTASFQKVPAKG